MVAAARPVLFSSGVVLASSVTVVGGGSVNIGPLGNITEADFASGQMHLVTLHGITEHSVFEWKPFGARNWERVGKTFLYPAIASQAQKLVDEAIRNDTFIPGMFIKPSEMTDPRRIVPESEYQRSIDKRKSDEFWKQLREKQRKEGGDL